MKYGFGHVNTYPRQRSALSRSESRRTSGNIASEVNREPEYSLHVKNAQIPIHFQGIQSDKLNSALNEFLADKTDSYKDKNGNEQSRAVRKDKHVLLASVYSWPEPVENYDPVKFKEFCNLCIQFFENEHKLDCQSAIIHLDESYPHLHVYGFSTDARAHVAGWVAKRESIKNGGSEKESNAAFKEAGRLYQDRYHEQVTKKMGLERLGPQRQRLDNKTFQILKNNKKVTSKLQELQESIVKTEISLQALNQSLMNSKIKQDAENLKLKEAELKNKKLKELNAQAERDLKRQNELARESVMNKLLISTSLKKLPEIEVLEKDLSESKKQESITQEKLKKALMENRSLSIRLNELNKALSLKENKNTLLQSELDRIIIENNILKQEIIDMTKNFKTQLSQATSRVNLLLSDFKVKENCNDKDEFSSLIIKK